MEQTQQEKANDRLQRMADRRREMTRCDAFAGYISRERAEEHLIKLDRIGAFLFCAPKDGTLVISLHTGNAEPPVRHYDINLNSNGEIFLEDVQPFRSFKDLISYYRDHGDFISTPLGQAAGVVDWEIDHFDLEKQERLGRGGCATVNRALWGVYEVAVKESNYPEFDSHLIHEVNIIKKLNHKNIVTFFGHCSKQPILVVTEYMRHGPAKEYVSQKGPTLTEFCLINICYQVCRGLRYLENSGTAHCDLHLRNVLLGGEEPFLIVKLADFGHTIDWSTSNKSKVDSKIKADVKRFGYILWNVFLLASGASSEEIWEASNKARRPHGFTKSLYRIFKSCTRSWPKIRPSFKTLEKNMRHLFFANENAPKMYKLIQDEADDDRYTPIDIEDKKKKLKIPK
ncbi:tyrosine-protein kinase Btk29A-like isoform X2 [Varroa jacobsoni]|uniref:tyrosine-protein kinase Btk29A-like isoform X2 n=1 Tax=Varroa jacobsoni TaxID=62625 RepID=UPI000BF5128C|nr:tyrosine-protein kinase Btk29A-like isoform X2 [Varroa jacobsoni]